MDVQKTMEFILDQQAHFAAGMAEMRLGMDQMRVGMEQLRLEHLKTEATLRRAIRLSVEAHRRERVRRQKLESETVDVKAAVADLTNTVNAFIKSLKNGH